MRYLVSTIVVATMLLGSTSASALARPGVCSLKGLAGTWAFSTDVSPNSPLGVEATALGIITIKPNGTSSGVFDVTFAHTNALRNVPFEGTVSVGKDCRGTGTLMTPSGPRTDSLIVLNRNEVWGMTLDPEGLWTYRWRRLSRRC